MTESVEKEIIRLYFYETYSYSELINHFKQKYSYGEIKNIIKKYLKKYEEMTNGKV